MAIFKAELFSIDQVLHFYESAEGENFKIFARMNPTDAYCRYSFTGSKDEGMSELNNALLQIKNNADNFNEYLLQVSSNVSRKGQKPEMTNITFQLNKPQYMGSIQQYQNNNTSRTEMLLEKLVEQNQMLVSRISALEAEEDFEVEEPEEDGLAGILKNPEVQSMLIGAIGRFISGNAPQTAAIAGIPKSEIEYSEAIEILESLMHKGVTIEHLQALNKMSSVKLQSLLLML
jgi:hypothetical protein